MQEITQNIFKEDTNKDAFKTFTFAILISLTVIQQMPIIKEIFYNQFRFLLYISFGVFSFSSLVKLSNIIEERLVKYSMISLVYSILIFILMMTLDKRVQIILVTELLIPIGILICSLNTKINTITLSKTISVYIILSSILGFTSIFYYGDGVRILKTYYLVGKNSIGPIIGISSVITLHRIFRHDKGRIRKSWTNNLLFNSLILCIQVISIITIRNRASIVAIFIMFLLMTIKKSAFRITLKSLIILQFTLIVILAMLMTGVLNQILDFIWSAITLNYDITDLNSISAGRIGVFTDSISFIKDNLLLGELNSVIIFGNTPHNFILNKIVKYGIIGAFPTIIFYIYLWIYAVKGVFRNKLSIYSSDITNWVLIFSLIVSLFEYTYPFGPGTSQIMVWFLIGQQLISKKENSLKLNLL